MVIVSKAIGISFKYFYFIIPSIGPFVLVDAHKYFEYMAGK